MKRSTYIMIKQRIENIRDLMKEKNIYAYIVPSSDYHQSEYVGDYFKSREFYRVSRDFNNIYERSWALD